MNKLYKDSNWLESKYVIEMLSDSEIGNLCKASSIVSRYWRKKFEISTRTRGERGHLAKANHCILSSEAVNWINGELLGDGCLYAQSNYSALVLYGSKFSEYIKYVSATLDSFGVKICGKINKYYHKKMDCYSYTYSSLCYEELLILRNNWYLNNKKIVPRNIKLTPLVCRQWYIGDGGLAHPKYGRPSIQLWTNGFPISDVEWLKGELVKLGFKATRWLTSNSIHISVDSTKDFLKYVGPCPVNRYQYKWDYDKLK